MTRENPMPQATERSMGPDHLLYKEDWPQARQRFLALWSGEIIDRACIAVAAPRPERKPLPRPASLEAMYTDVDYTLAVTNATLGNTFYGGEAVPLGRTLLGYVAFGGEPTFDEATIWVQPAIHDWHAPYPFESDNHWRRRFIELTHALIEDGHDANKYLVETTGATTPMDSLLTLRGSEKLCLDLLTQPESVKAAHEALTGAFLRLRETLYSRIPAEHGWMVRWMWAPGRTSMTACDFSAMIGNESFREFVIPEIKALAADLDYCVYHLDGAQALHHLPAILELDCVHSIQWARGAGDLRDGTALRWVEMARQVQAAGKVFNIEVRLDEVEPLLKALDPRRLFIRTTAPSVEAAQSLLRQAERWSCKGITPV